MWVLYLFWLLVNENISHGLQPPRLNVSTSFINVRPEETELTLHCEGEHVIQWKYPDHVRENPSLGREIRQTNKTEKSKSISIFFKPLYLYTGMYICFYKDKTDVINTKNSDSVYVFFNDQDHLFLPQTKLNYSLEFNSHTYVPCLPTSTITKVTLLEQKNNSEPSTVESATTKFDPTKGFLIREPVSKRYFCEGSLDGFKRNSPFFNIEAKEDVIAKPLIETKSTVWKKGDLVTIECSLVLSKDSPLTPNITWEFPGDSNTPRNNRVTISSAGYKLFESVLVLPNITPLNEGHFICAVTFDNNGQKLRDEIYISINETGSEPSGPAGLSDTQIILYTVMTIAIALSILSIFCLIYQCKKNRKHKMFDIDLLSRGQSFLLNDELPLQEQIELLPYDSYFEFPKNRLKFGGIIGHGDYGKVVKAKAKKLDPNVPHTTVAVKMVKENYSPSQHRSLMAELKILIHLRKHVNIMNLLGAVTKNFYKGELMIMVDYCPYGNLRLYLLKNRTKFLNPADSDLQDVELKSTTETKNTEEEDSKLNRFKACKNDNKNPRVITTSDLLCFCFQIARGMNYLHSRQFIHRELAAKAILVCKGNVLKISDFGLSRDLYKYWNYVEKEEEPLPVKWMAFESLRDKTFSTKSDAWSFGVVLWEIFSLGVEPYPKIEGLEELYKKVENGYRMDKPKFASEEIYQMMRNCWEMNPRCRPDFNQLSDKIGSMLDENTTNHYINLNLPFEEQNEKYLKRLSVGSIRKIEEDIPPPW